MWALNAVGSAHWFADPDEADYKVPGNDDPIRSIKLFTSKIADACLEGAARYRASGAAERLFGRRINPGR